MRFQTRECSLTSAASSLYRAHINIRVCIYIEIVMYSYGARGQISSVKCFSTRRIRLLSPSKCESIRKFRYEMPGCWIIHRQQFGWEHSQDYWMPLLEVKQASPPTVAARAFPKCLSDQAICRGLILFIRDSWDLRVLLENTWNFD